MSSHWTHTVSECLAAFEREQIGSPCPVVDHEIVRGRTGAPEDATIWLVCRTRSEQRNFRDSELSRSRSTLSRSLIAAGLSEAVVDGLEIRVTSREEVTQRGGFAAYL